MSGIKTSSFLILFISVFISTVFAQETKKYVKGGVAFEYSQGWELTEKADKETSQISLSNAEADSQISIIVIHRPINSKEPMAEAKKRVIDPWITTLIDQYTRIAQVKIDRSEIKTEVAGQPADGVKLAFILDAQGGRVEACWALLEKRLVLFYIVGPDKKGGIASLGWESVRQTIRIAEREK